MSPGDTFMSKSMEISTCTLQDHNQILEALPEFWDGRDTRQLHQTFLIHEFGNSAFVIRGASVVVAYLFGFISQTQPVGCVHAIAVRACARRRHLAQHLFDHFAVRPPPWLYPCQGDNNAVEFGLDGKPIIADYTGRSASRVVFWKAI